MQPLHLQGGDITAGAAGLPAVRRCWAFKYLDSVCESAEYKKTCSVFFLHLFCLWVTFRITPPSPNGRRFKPTAWNFRPATFWFFTIEGQLCSFIFLSFFISHPSFVPFWPESEREGTLLCPIRTASPCRTFPPTSVDWRWDRFTGKWNKNEEADKCGTGHLAPRVCAHVCVCAHTY